MFSAFGSFGRMGASGGILAVPLAPTLAVVSPATNPPSFEVMVSSGQGGSSDIEVGDIIESMIDGTDIYDGSPITQDELDDGYISVSTDVINSGNHTIQARIKRPGPPIIFSPWSNSLSFTMDASIVLSNATAIQTGSSSASIGITTNFAAGTWYWIVTTNSTLPTSSQIISGVDAGGVAAAASGNLAITSASAASDNVTGLSPTTTYYAYSTQSYGSTYADVLASQSFTTQDVNSYGFISGSLFTVPTGTTTINFSCDIGDAADNRTIFACVAIIQSTANITSAILDPGGANISLNLIRSGTRDYLTTIFNAGVPASAGSGIKNVQVTLASAVTATAFVSASFYKAYGLNSNAEKVGTSQKYSGTTFSYVVGDVDVADVVLVATTTIPNVTISYANSTQVPNLDYSNEYFNSNSLEAAATYDPFTIAGTTNQPYEMLVSTFR